MNSATLVQKLWNYCNVLRDDGMSYGDYVEQLTYLLFLKMADERSRPPYHQPSPIPAPYAWPMLLAKDGDALFDHYRHTLEELGKQPGTLALIFGKAQNKFQDPAKLRRVIVDLIDGENWSAMGADVKGDAYEGLLERNAQDIKSGAGQYFTPRALIQAMVDCIAPKPGEVICDPACGTGGFLFTAHHYLTQHNPNLTRDEKRHLKEGAFRGWELVQATARVCAMNLMLHGIGSETSVPVKVADALAADPGERFDVVLANPPFGKKSSTMIVGEDGKTFTEKDIVERDDFWATTSNKQLNFVQHTKNAAEIARPRRGGGARQRAVRGRRRRDHPPQADARMRRAHPAPPADGPVLRAGREGQRDLLRQEAGQRNAVDQEALDLRPAHQQTFHAEDQPAQARGPR
jgi:type I restriction enzyme M protein